MKLSPNFANALLTISANLNKAWVLVLVGVHDSHWPNHFSLKNSFIIQYVLKYRRNAIAISLPQNSLICINVTKSYINQQNKNSKITIRYRKDISFKTNIWFGHYWCTDLWSHGSLWHFTDILSTKFGTFSGDCVLHFISKVQVIYISIKGTVQQRKYWSYHYHKINIQV